MAKMNQPELFNEPNLIFTFLWLFQVDQRSPSYICAVFASLWYTKKKYYNPIKRQEDDGRWRNYLLKKVGKKIRKASFFYMLQDQAVKCGDITLLHLKAIFTASL